MSKLAWDQTGERYYETGVRNGVLYPMDPITATYPKGVAWSGLINVTESPSGAEPNPLFADDIKYLNLISAEEFGATVEAYTHPVEFYACDGTGELASGVYIGQQNRQPFGLAYRTVLGNDTMLNDYGYKLHIIYGGVASVSEKAYGTINDSPDAITLSWEVSTTPVNVPGFKPTALLTIDSTKSDKAKLKILEDILYGIDSIGIKTEGSILTWADLFTISGGLTTNEKGLAWLVGADNMIYIWDGTGFPAEGEGVPYNVEYVPGIDARLPLPDEIAAIFAQS
jgi:hypothetical protein